MWARSWGVSFGVPHVTAAAQPLQKDSSYTILIRIVARI